VLAIEPLEGPSTLPECNRSPDQSPGDARQRCGGPFEGDTESVASAGRYFSATAEAPERSRAGRNAQFFITLAPTKAAEILADSVKVTLTATGAKLTRTELGTQDASLLSPQRVAFTVNYLAPEPGLVVVEAIVAFKIKGEDTTRDFTANLHWSSFALAAGEPLWEAAKPDPHHHEGAMPLPMRLDEATGTNLLLYLLIGLLAGALVIVLGSVWMYRDARRLGLQAAGWLLAGLFLFGLALPWYLIVARPRAVRRQHQP
jgi:hypothetical protein